jgi:PAS domain S-box-containing protein
MDRLLNFLIVEDNLAEAERMEAVLARSGLAFSLKRISTFEEFRLELDMLPPDLILSEYSLPNFHVVEALKWLQDEKRDVPLILVTGSHSEEAVVQCMKLGAQDYILKQSLIRLPPAVKNAVTQKQVQRDKATTEAQYRLITESTRDLIVLLDLKYEVIYASPSFKRTLQHDPSALEGIPLLSLVHPKDIPPLEKSLEEALFFREARNVELRLCHANGSWQYFEATVSHIFDAQGKSAQALIVSRDTSDRKRAEKEIRKLAAFARFNPNPVLEFSADGSLTYFNDSAMNMARTLQKAHPHMILPLNAATIVKRCLATGKNQLHLETTLAGRVLSWSFFPVVGNQVVHCYAEDVTESRHLEASLRQAQKMESIGQLAAGVAHDFNNILTVIQGHANLMLSLPDLDQFLSQSARQIATASERAAGLTRQLLMFSRKQMLQPQLLDLNDTIQNVNKMLRSMLGERITLKRDLATQLPAVHADPGMIEQVLVNLVVNARDAISQTGTVTIETASLDITETYVQQHPNARPGSFVCLKVSDTGHGMDKSILTHIFEPFFTTKEVGRGTGLGLATVYGIVKQHEGWIDVESEVNVGSTFKIFLPVSTKAPAKTDPHLNDSTPGGHETILVVEDEAALRELVHEILHKKGYKILEAPNGVKALEVWHQHKDDIALLLTDMMMPESLSGRQLAEKILAEKEDLPVLFISGYSLDVVDPGFTVKHGQIFLQKPFHPHTLARAVRDCLNRQVPAQLQPTLNQASAA